MEPIFSFSFYVLNVSERSGPESRRSPRFNLADPHHRQEVVNASAALIHQECCLFQNSPHWCSAEE